MLTPSGANQGELIDFLKALRNRCFGKPTLATGTTAARIKITNQVDYMIDGVIYRKAAADNISMAAIAASALTGVGQTVAVRVEIDSGGTVTFKPGAVITGSQGTAAAAPRTASRTTLGILDFPASFTPNTTSTATVTFTDGDPDLGVEDLYVAGAGVPSLES